MLEGIRDRTIWFYLLVLNFRNIIFKVPRKKGKKMKQNKKSSVYIYEKKSGCYI